MKPYILILRFFLLLGAISLLPACQNTEERDFYELKIYRYNTADQEKSLDTYLGEAYLPALHRQGINDVGVFKLREEGNEIRDALLVLVPFTSLPEYADLPAKLNNDQEYLEAGKDYIEAIHDDPPYTRIESILMRAFEETPLLETPTFDSPRRERVYELRSYQASTELLYERKVEMFNVGESALFQKLGFQPVFFGEVISSSRMPHLMYMTTFSDTVSQKEKWNAFRVHPEWEKMKEIERYKHTVSHISKYLLYPTEYSDY
jgi:hypothetical protein